MRHGTAPADIWIDVSSIRDWAVVLGLTGFVCGFLGPLVLNPWANQGPLAGLLITGPGGAILGALLGAVTHRMRVSAAAQRRWRLGIAAIGAVAILVTALPAPDYRASILDLTVRDCVPAADWRERALATWERRLATNVAIWGDPPADWRETLATATSTGAVLTVDIERHRDVGASRRYWNFGAVTATPWEPGAPRRLARREHVYWRGTCPGPDHGTWLATPGADDNGHPPADPARVLDMHAVDAMPPELAVYAH